MRAPHLLLLFACLLAGARAARLLTGGDAASEVDAGPVDRKSKKTEGWFCKDRDCPEFRVVNCGGPR